MTDFYASHPQPLDQADGLRRMFSAHRARVVTLVANPQVAFAGVLIERLTAAFAREGLHTLIVDAADWSPAPAEVSLLDLSACVETLSAEVSYLAARGLPMRHLDTRGSTAGFVDAVAEAAPHADVVLVHASASDLCRLFMRRPLRPVLMAGDGAEALTQAYGALKLLASRHGVAAFDLLLAAAPGTARAEAVVKRLAGCADDFLASALVRWAVVDPASDVNDPLPPALCALAHDLLTFDETAAGSPWTAGRPPPTHVQDDVPTWVRN